MKYDKIIICSKDGTYRAPVAAEALKKALKEKNYGVDIEIQARGVVVLFPEPVNGKAVAIGKSKGYDLENLQSEPLCEQDFCSENLILVMTDMGKKTVYDTFVKAINVYTVKEFIGIAGDVEIPFGMPLGNYGDSFNYIEELMSQVADKLISMKKED